MFFLFRLFVFVYQGLAWHYYVQLKHWQAESEFCKMLKHGRLEVCGYQMYCTYLCIVCMFTSSLGAIRSHFLLCFGQYAPCSFLEAIYSILGLTMWSESTAEKCVAFWSYWVQKKFCRWDLYPAWINVEFVFEYRWQCTSYIDQACLYCTDGWSSLWMFWRGCKIQIQYINARDLM